MRPKRIGSTSVESRRPVLVQWVAETLVSCTTISEWGEGTADATPNNVTTNGRTLAERIYRMKTEKEVQRHVFKQRIRFHMNTIDRLSPTWTRIPITHSLFLESPVFPWFSAVVFIDV